MAQLQIKITHVAWREGRPRFVPGQTLRALGFKGEDLRHPGGAWFTPQEAQAWVNQREALIAERRAKAQTASANGQRLPRMPQAKSPAHMTVEGLFDAWFKSPRMTGQQVEDGKRRQKAAAPATIRDYKQKARAIAQFDPVIYGSAVAALTTPILYDLYERLWTARGLATARGAIATLSSAISWAIRRGRIQLASNPALGLNMEMPEPRVRAATPDEIRQLVTAADLTGRPEIGDAILLGVWTGQRQSDRLALLDAGLFDGRRMFRQNKTRAIVEIVESPELEARITAARARRKDWTVQPLHIIVDEAQRAPFRADHYRHCFARVRNAATNGIIDASAPRQPGQPPLYLLEPMPSLSDFHDQDIRDTAVTWLARAGCTMPQIAQITGHSLASVQTILKHYLASHREIADQAIAKLVTWHEAQK